jgi:hypothetical protein
LRRKDLNVKNRQREESPASEEPPIKKTKILEDLLRTANKFLTNMEVVLEEKPYGMDYSRELIGYQQTIDLLEMYLWAIN